MPAYLRTTSLRSNSRAGTPIPVASILFWGAFPARRAIGFSAILRGAMGAMLSLSDRNVSKLKQVAPVITGQQSVDAVVLRVTAEQNQLRSAAWDEQPRAFSLRSLRKSSSRG